MESSAREGISVRVWLKVNGPLYLLMNVSIWYCSLIQCNDTVAMGGPFARQEIDMGDKRVASELNCGRWVSGDGFGGARKGFGGGRTEWMRGRGGRGAGCRGGGGGGGDAKGKEKTKEEKRKEGEGKSGDWVQVNLDNAFKIPLVPISADSNGTEHLRFENAIALL